MTSRCSRAATGDPSASAASSRTSDPSSDRAVACCAAGVRRRHDAYAAAHLRCCRFCERHARNSQ
eukprot:4641796-Prymnesium_polylepis.1